MKDFKEIVKENKKRALSIAVATAFLVSGPLGIAGCYNPQKKKRRGRKSIWRIWWRKLFWRWHFRFIELEVF